MGSCALGKVIISSIIYRDEIERNICIDFLPVIER